MTNPHRDICPDLLYELEYMPPEELRPPGGVCARWATMMPENGYIVWQVEGHCGLFPAYEMELKMVGL